MLSNENKIIGLILNLITCCEIIFGLLISLILIFIIIYYFYKKRIKRENKTILILSIHIYLISLIYMGLFFVLNIQMILGDIQQREFSSSSCITMAYIYSSILCAMYLSFINQALFRLCRIVYPHYRWLQHRRLYIIIFFIELIFAFILLCPIYILGDIIYLPNDHVCFVPISNIRGFLWIFFTVYGIPVLLLSIIYIRITIFIRKQSNNRSLLIKRRQDRDLLAIRRIIIIVGFLHLLGFPTMILIIMMLITGEEHPLTIRITCLAIGTSMVGLSLGMIFSVVQLKKIISNIFKPNVVTTINGTLTGTIQTRTNVFNNNRL